MAMTAADIDALITRVETGAYTIENALEEIAAAAKGSDVRAALYALAYTLNKEGKTGSVDLIARENINLANKRIDNLISLPTVPGDAATEDSIAFTSIVSEDVQSNIVCNGESVTVTITDMNLTLEDNYGHAIGYLPEKYAPLAGPGSVISLIRTNSAAGKCIKIQILADDYKYSIDQRKILLYNLSDEPVTINYLDFTYPLKTPFASAEITDLRIGADGTIYESAGEAVRQQVSQLSEDVEQLKQGGSVTTVTKIASVSLSEGQTATLELTAKAQNVIPVWTDPVSETGVTFTNQLIKASEDISFPYTTGTGYFNFANILSVNSDKYYSWMVYLEIPDGATISVNAAYWAQMNVGSVATISESGWYKYFAPYYAGITNTNPTFNVKDVGVTIKYLYGILSDTKEEARISEDYWGLPLVPETEEYTYSSDGSSEKASATVTMDNSTVTYTSEDAEITIGASAIIECTKGSISFDYEYIASVESDSENKQTVYSIYPDWSDWTWIIVGDSLTDETINATKKYYVSDE